MRLHRGPPDPLVLLPKPTLAGQKGWDRLVLELRQGVLAEQIRPITRHHQGQEFCRGRLQTGAFLCGGEQVEPKEAIRLQGQQIRQFAHEWKGAAPKKLDRLAAAELRQIEFDRLRRAREIGDAEDDLVIEDAEIGDDLTVRRVEKPQRAAAERAPRAPAGDQPLYPVQQR